MIQDALCNFGSVTITGSNPAAGARVYFPDVLDRGALIDEIGSGEPLMVEFRCTTGWGGAGGLQMGLAAADDSAMSSNVVDLASTQSLLTGNYGTVAQQVIYAVLPPLPSNLKKRYLGAYIEAPSVFTASAGAVTARLVPYSMASTTIPHLYVSAIKVDR